MTLSEAGGIQGRSRQRDRHRQTVCDGVNQTIARHAPQLLTEEKQLLVSAECVDTVLRHIPRYSSARDQRIQRHHFWNLLQNGARKLEWKVEKLPDLIIALPVDRSRFEPALHASASIVTELHVRYLAELGKDWDRYADDNRHRAGQMLFSAIVSGALMVKSYLRQFPDTIRQPLQTHDALAWLEFDTGRPGEHPQSKDTRTTPVRRWMPDPVTQALILRWKGDNQTWPTGNGSTIDALLIYYLSHLGCTCKKTCKQLDIYLYSPDQKDKECVRSHTISMEAFLLRAAEYRWRLKLPSILIDYATDHGMAPSLPASAWQRFMLGGRLPPAAVADSEETCEEEDVPDEELLADRADAGHSTDREHIKGVRKLFRRRKAFVKRSAAISSLDKYLTANGQDISPILNLLLKWARWNLLERLEGRGRIKVSSVVRYLSALMVPLSTYGGQLELSKLVGAGAVDGYRALYDIVADNCTTQKQRTYTADRINEFHRFLIFNIGAPEFDWRGFSMRATKGAGRSNLITEVEYQALHTAIDGIGAPDREILRLKLLATMLYRCGMRRGELEGRQIADVHGFDWTSRHRLSRRPQLWIHVAGSATVKFPASERRLPLALLLSKSELKMFTDWCQLRRSESGNTLMSRTLLFAGRGDPKDVEDVTNAVNLLQAMLRQITGDPDIVIHHLRHSFISLLSARGLLREAELMTSVAGVYEHPLIRLPGTCSVEEVLGKTEEIIKRLRQTTELPRDYIYMVSKLAGHVDPRETTQTYSHLFDYVLGVMTRVCSTNVDTLTMSKLLGRKMSSVYVHRHRAGPKENLAKEFGGYWMSLEANKHAAKAGHVKVLPSLEPLPDIRTVNTGAVASLELKPIDLSMMQLHDLLRRAQMRERPLERSRSFGLSTSQISSIVKAASNLAAIKTNMRSEEARHSRILNQPKPRKVTGVARRYAQVEHFAPAIPSQLNERREANRVYWALTKALKEGTLDVGSLQQTINCMSRSKSELFVNSQEGLSAVAKVLNAAGVARTRMAIEVLTWPKASRGAAKKVISAILGKRSQHHLLPREPTKSIPGRSFGRLAVHVRTHAANNGKNIDATGWKVASYFAMLARMTEANLRAKKSHPSVKI